MSRRFLALLGVLVVLALLLGLGHLFMMRFRAGDVYPPYSTFRSDPLGTRVLYDSLAALPGMTVERNVEPVERLEGTPHTVLLFLGDTVSFSPNQDRLPAATAAWLSRFVRDGGRIVVTLQPRDRFWTGLDDGEGTNCASCGTWPFGRCDTNRTDAAAATNTTPHLKDDADDERRWNRGVALTNWLDAAFGRLPVSGTATAVVTVTGREAGLPARLDCQTALCFTNVGVAWRVLYACAGMPVIIERPMGRGSFVMSTLSYPVSNEAMRDGRQTGLLVWLLGGRSRAVFDETHHGLEEKPGLMTLVRRYGLTWALLNLLVLAGLFVWRNGAPLVPAEAADLESDAGVAVGKDSATGLGNLLRRNVRPADLLATCLAAWKRTADPATRLPESAVKRVEAMIEAERLLPDGQRSPQRLYNAICENVKQEARAGNRQGRP